MVVKLKMPLHVLGVEFESCVVLDGSQTLRFILLLKLSFESCVVLDGSQTLPVFIISVLLFESCVVLDGSQTERDVPERCLRVVPFYLFAGAARSFGARRAAKSSG